MLLQMHFRLAVRNLDHSVERSHPHTEKFIQIVGKNPQKSQTIVNVILLICSLLQHPTVERQPTYIPVNQ
jgi:hypothetical protein